jgi:translation initiation factor IF-2
VPTAGDLFVTVKNEKEARILAAEYKNKQKQRSEAERHTVTLEKLFEQFMAGEVPELRLIVKADVQGSLEPIVTSLNNLNVGDIAINILQASTGNIGENDIMLATASKAIVVGFNVKADETARRQAESEGISIRLYNIIYRLIEDVEKALKGMLAPEEKITVLGKAEVRATFHIRKTGLVAGCYVVDGELRRNALVQVLRNNEVIFDGEMASLKRHEEDVTEVRRGFECGVSVKGFDGFKTGDIIQCYIKELVAVQ